MESVNVRQNNLTANRKTKIKKPKLKFLSKWVQLLIFIFHIIFGIVNENLTFVFILQEFDVVHTPCSW